MVTKTTSSSQVFSMQPASQKWVLPGSGCLYRGPKVNGAGVKTTVVVKTSVKDSVKSPNYWLKKPVRVAWKPTRPYRLQEPRLPVLHRSKPPRQPFYRVKLLQVKPSRYKGSNPKSEAELVALGKRSDLRVIAEKRAQKAYQKRLQRYHNAYAKWEQKEKSKVERYKVAMERYNVKLKRYQKVKNLLESGRATFKRVRNVKVIQNNPFTQTDTEYYPPFGKMEIRTYYRNFTTLPSCRYKDFSQGYGKSEKYDVNYYDGCLEGFVISTFPVPDVASKAAATLSADSRARSKIYGKLNQYDLHIGNIIAERHQTMKMLADTLKFIGSSTKLKITSKKIADDFLAFMFGVKPLIDDAYAAGSALARLLDTEKSDKIVVRCSSRGTSSSRGVTHQQGGGVSLYQLTHELQTTVEVRYVLEYKITNGPLEVLQGLGLANPAEIAWEMMPWSFVIDWFLPIGKYLQSLNSDTALTFVGGVKTVVTTDEWINTYSGSSYSPSYSQGYELTATSMKKVRSKVRTLVTVPPAKPLPQFKNPLSAYHLAEALALVVQRFK